MHKKIINFSSFCSVVCVVLQLNFIPFSSNRQCDDFNYSFNTVLGYFAVNATPCTSKHPPTTRMTQSTVGLFTGTVSAVGTLLIFGQPASTLDHLTRLASKPGVQSTLIISKADGSIIRSTGLLSSSPAVSSAASLHSSVSSTSPMNHGPDSDTAKETHDEAGGYSDKREGCAQTAEDVAKMVYSFVSAAGGLVEGLNRGDEVRLLRLRTKKNELVIVPGS